MIIPDGGLLFWGHPVYSNAGPAWKTHLVSFTSQECWKRRPISKFIRILKS